MVSLGAVKLRSLVLWGMECRVVVRAGDGDTRLSAKIHLSRQQNSYAVRIDQKVGLSILLLPATRVCRRLELKSRSHLGTIRQ